jgi:lipopolysaccharide export system ATP-binding protein
MHPSTITDPTPTVAPVRSEIVAAGLIKTFGARNVVDGVNLRIGAGEIVGLLGRNGAGKTTAFYMIVGLVPATAGTIALDGRDLTRLPMHQRARHGIGYLPQEASVFRKLTVEENILAIVEVIDVPRAERATRVAHHLAELSLSHLAKQKAFTLSGGERRRLEIARALVTRPKFLLMDEPFAAIDPISVAEVQKIILELKARGIGIIITDHNVRETLRIVDRAYLLEKGKVHFEGTGAELIKDEQARRFYLGEGFNL